MTFHKPTLIYDGDCGLCRASMNWLQKRVGDRLDYVASQERDGNFSKLPEELFRSTVVLVHPDGHYTIKAQAALEALTLTKKHSMLRWAYAKLPGFDKVSDWVYDQVAKRRYLWSKWKHF